MTLASHSADSGELAEMLRQTMVMDTSVILELSDELLINYDWVLFCNLFRK